jgi:hypothetical protein
MITTLLRKARTLSDTLVDFYIEPLASFRELEEGLKDRRAPVAPQVVERVLAAYRAAKRDQQSAGPEYQATGQWTALIEMKLKAFKADKMSQVLGGFFRDEDVFFGLCDYATPPHLKSQHLMTRILFVNSMLYDYRRWSDLTGKDVSAIRTPWVGNPFGYFIEGTLAVPGSFRHHYMANKAVALMNGDGVLGEIGGGWGDVGYYALQAPGIHYLDLDLPEILLLASFWLCSTMPERKIVLYGEQDLGTVLTKIDNYDAILLPNFCFPCLPDHTMDVVLNTHSMSEMDGQTVQEYLRQIERTCKSYFLHENSDTAYHTLGFTEIPASTFWVEGFRLLNKAISPWKAGGGRYREFVFERMR